ncbi:hypothetical protein ACFL6C_11955 [Myxococcota bacterium]
MSIDAVSFKHLLDYFEKHGTDLSQTALQNARSEIDPIAHDTIDVLVADPVAYKALCEMVIEAGGNRPTTTLEDLRAATPHLPADQAPVLTDAQKGLMQVMDQSLDRLIAARVGIAFVDRDAREKVYDAQGFDDARKERMEEILRSFVRNSNSELFLMNAGLLCRVGIWAPFDWEESGMIQDTLFKIVSNPPWRNHSVRDPEVDWKGVKNIELRVHPMYGLLKARADMAAWIQSGKDIDRYMESQLLALAQKAHHALVSEPPVDEDTRKNALIELYTAFELLEELEATQNPSTAPDTAVVYLMPNRGFLSDAQRQVMDALIAKYGPGAAVMNSTFADNGYLQGADMDALKQKLPRGVTISLRGGLADQCMGDAARDIKNIRPDVRFVVHEVGTSSVVPESVQEPNSIPNKAPTSIAELRAWLDANPETIEELKTRATSGVQHRLNEKFE